MGRSSPKKKRLPWTKDAVSGGPEYQFYDPLSGLEVRFPNRLHRDNYLVQFGEPDVVEIIPEYPTVSVLLNGELTVTRFDATVRYLEGACVFQEVKPKAIVTSAAERVDIAKQLAAQKRFAELNGAGYEIRTETEIYEFPTLVESKRRMRQVLTLHRDDC